MSSRKTSYLEGPEVPVRLGPIKQAPPVSHPTPCVYSRRELTEQRLQDLAGDDPTKFLSPVTEATLRCFGLDDSPATGDDVFLVLHNNGIDAGFSTIRASIAFLHSKDYITPAPIPADAVRRGPRTGYYQITIKGRRVLDQSDDLLTTLRETA